MKRTKKLVKNFILFLVLIIITFYIILKDQDITEIINIVFSVKKEFILIAVLCMILYLSCEAINIRRTLRTLNENLSFPKALKIAFIGFFFSSITPAASGGQPMQIYYMHQDNVSVANSTLALLINLSCVQIVTISIALFSLIFNYQYLNTALIWFLILGITLNLTALTLLLISIFSKRMTNGILKLTVRILTFFKVKNIQQKQERFQSELTKYQGSSNYVKKNKKLMLKILLTTYIQYILFYSISYWVYRSFGLQGHNAFEIITLQSVLYATVSGIPSPGAIGVSEGGFLAIFKSIFTQDQLRSAMLLSRGVNFYLFVVISSIIVMVSTLRDKRKQKQEIVEENPVEKN